MNNISSEMIQTLEKNMISNLNDSVYNKTDFDLRIITRNISTWSIDVLIHMRIWMPVQDNPVMENIFSSVEDSIYKIVDDEVYYTTIDMIRKEISIKTDLNLYKEML